MESLDKYDLRGNSSLAVQMSRYLYKSKIKENLKYIT
jgi:hypothetical protein